MIIKVNPNPVVFPQNSNALNPNNPLNPNNNPLSPTDTKTLMATAAVFASGNMTNAEIALTGVVAVVLAVSIGVAFGKISEAYWVDRAPSQACPV